MNYLISSFNPRPTDLFNWIYLIHVSFEFVFLGFLASSLHTEKNTEKRAERKSKPTKNRRRQMNYAKDLGVIGICIGSANTYNNMK